MSAPAYRPPTRTLMGPGPSDVPEAVLQAMARPTVGHLDPTFGAMMEDLKALLRATLRTENALTIPISAPGSAGMEACFVNLVEPGDTVVVCRNGVFGERMRENVERIGATPVVVDDAWGDPVDPAKVEAALAAHPEASTVAFVQAETSTGAHTEVAPLVALAHAHECLAIVDVVTALGGMPVEVDAWDVDAIYAGSQKCLSCPPGLAPLSFGERAVERMRARKTKVQSWFLDLSLVMGYWGREGGRTYHHTAPVNAMYGLYEALRLIEAEGLDRVIRRHREQHERLVEGLEGLGLELAVAPEHRLPMLNAVRVPDGVDDAAVRRRLLDEYGIEIGAGLGAFAGRIWRIGLMGHVARPENVDALVAALKTILGR